MMSINTLMPMRSVGKANMHFTAALWLVVSAASFPQPVRRDPHLCLDCGSARPVLASQNSSSTG